MDTGGGAPGPATRGQQRFIIRFRASSRPAAGSAALRQQLRDVAAAAGIDGLDWQRRLGVGADLATTPHPLDAAATARLLDVLNARPDVEYAEADRIAAPAPHPRPGG